MFRNAFKALLGGGVVLGFLPGCGWGCADALVGYDITGRLVNADTSEPLAGAEVTVQLFRNGELVGYGNVHDPATTDETGRLETSYIFGFTGPCFSLVEALVGVTLDESPLGELADHIELVVTSADGSGRLVMPLEESHFVEFQDAWGVPFIGVIELGDIPVEISE